MFASSQLSTRSEHVALPGAQTLRRVWDLITAEAGLDAWRILELNSANGLPFEARLSWSAGQGAASEARLTVAHASRVCVYARSLKVAVRNLARSDNHVVATVADGFSPTANQLEVTGHAEPGQPTLIRVPSFARSLRIESSAGIDAGELRLFDGGHTLRCRMPLDAQPGSGVAVGGASLVELEFTRAADWRAVFGLVL